MAEARKCNRCHKCFDHLDQGLKLMARFKSPVFQKSSDILEHNAGYYLDDQGPDTYVDLCPDCSESFQLFMSGYPLAIEKGYLDKPDA